MDRTHKMLLFRIIIDFAHLMCNSLQCQVVHSTRVHSPSKDMRQNEFIEYCVLDVPHIQRTVFPVSTLRQLLS